ncbi:MAG: hypothetical protein HY430_00265 [Candidatus Levybacteria bacterium]|nr:hypothetical protein [Candidatus Levybacteria bacterium]
MSAEQEKHRSGLAEEGRQEPELKVVLTTNPAINELARRLALPINWSALTDYVRIDITLRQLQRLPHDPGFFAEAIVDMELDRLIKDGYEVFTSPIPPGTHVDRFIFSKKESGKFGRTIARWEQSGKRTYSVEYDNIATIGRILGVMDVTITSNQNTFNRATRNSHINRIFRPLQEHSGPVPFFFLLIGTRDTVHGREPQEAFQRNGGILVGLDTTTGEYRENVRKITRDLNGRYFGLSEQQNRITE